jgi:hypothetical protein
MSTSSPRDSTPCCAIASRARAMGRIGRQQVTDAWTVETMLDRLDAMYTRNTKDRVA